MMELREVGDVITGYPETGVFAVLSDIHANRAALDAVLAALGALGIQSDRVLNLGDAFGYGPEPEAILERLEGFCVNLYGNHDVMVKMALEERLGELTGMSTEQMQADPFLRVAIDHARRLRHEASDILDRIGSFKTWAVLEESHLLIHDSPRTYLTLDIPQDRLVTSDDLAQAFTAMVHHGFLVTLHGHDHVASWCHVTDEEVPGNPEFGRLNDHAVDGSRRTIIDVGSVGQPRDGDPRAAAAVICFNGGGRIDRILPLRIDYPIDETASRLRRLAYPRFFADRLQRGV